MTPDDAPMQDIIRIAIVGAGGNTRKMHIPKLQAIDGIEIVGVVNRSPESSQRAAQEFGIARTYSHWQEAVQDTEVDAIVIGTWPYLHAPITLAALSQGKHVLTEARMALNAQEARAMLEASRMRPDLVAQIVPSPFTLTLDRTIQRLIAEGYLGELLTLEVKAGGGFIDYDGEMQWRHDLDLSGVNTMMLGIWYEAVMRWVGHAKSVVAGSKTFVKHRQTADGRRQSIGIPDHLDVIADMECGAQAHFQMSAVNGWMDNAATLYGSEGVLKIEGGKLFGGQRSEDGMQAIAIPQEEAIGWRVEEAFINAIRGKEAVTRTTFVDGVKYMEFTEAAIISAQEGQRISLPLH